MIASIPEQPALQAVSLSEIRIRLGQRRVKSRISRLIWSVRLQCFASVGGSPSVPIATMIRSQVSAPSLSPFRRISSTITADLVYFVFNLLFFDGEDLTRWMVHIR
jgi:hypothetical protein